MLKSNTKKLIIVLIAVLMLIAVSYKSFATNGQLPNNTITDPNEMLNGNAGDREEIPEGPNKVGNEIKDENKNVNKNTPETTPYTGVGDYSTIIFIVVFAISAIYAYKKIRDYNV